jgi:uncharacterized protein YndB with AHSA1/START domain
MTLPNSENTFTLTRVFNAPRETVYKMWTEIAHLKNWSGPAGVSMEYKKSEIKVGGIVHYCMNLQDGSKMWGKTLYRELTKPSKLVYVQYFSNEKEEITNHPMSPTWPKEMLTTILFEEKDKQTLLTLRWQPINASALELDTFKKAFEGMRHGWDGSFGNLDFYIAKTVDTSDREIITTRLINAMPEKVYSAFTEAKHLMNWWGPNGFTTTTHEMNFAIGGKWLFIMHGPDGVDYPNCIKYKNIIPNQRIEYEHGVAVDGPAHFCNIITFEKVEMQTLVTMRAILPTVEILNEMKKFGAAEGGKQTIARLDQFICQTQGEFDLVITRRIKTNIANVYSAWVNQNELAKWWGPRYFVNPVCVFEPKINGKIQIEMEAPDGTFYKYLGVVQEIINNEKLVFTTKLVDTHGKPLVETLNTIHFSQAKDFAVLTLHAKNVLATEMGREFLNSQEESWLSSFEKLETLLSK